MVRVEVTCCRCPANVLVLLVQPKAGGAHGEPDPADLSRRIAGHGWANTGSGACCTECRMKPATAPEHSQVDERPQEPKPKRRRYRKEVIGEAIPD